MDRTQIYRDVTDKVLARMKQGGHAWRMPWKNRGTGIPRNATTQRAYQGVNSLILHMEAAEMGYGCAEWLTYKQATAVGAQVRKGEKGTHVVFYKSLSITENKGTPEEKRKTIPLLRLFTVFNLKQCDGLARPASGGLAFDPIPVIAEFIAKTGARIEHGGDSAYYRPALDTITLPEHSQFTSVSAYYATALHELTHWTGHRERLNRESLYQYNADKRIRAAEELIAELGAAMLCGEFGIDSELERHAGYLADWIELLTDDPKAIFTAAAAASKAANFLHGENRMAELEAFPEPDGVVDNA